MQLDQVRLFEKQEQAHSEVVQESVAVTVRATETLRAATADFNESLDSLKKIHKKQIEDKDRAIRIMAIAIVIMAACCIGLGTKLIINKC